MKKTVIKAFALMGVMVLFASCVKEVVSNNELYRPEGTPIVFAAETGYNNGIETRTTYSGFDEDGHSVGSSSTYERIDWVADDEILIKYASHGSSVYYVGSDQTISAEKNTAPIWSDNQLTWAGGNSDHVFYGIYPNNGYSAGHGANGVFSFANNSDSQVNGSVPNAQTVYWNNAKGVYEPDMALGYLVCKKTVSASSTERTVDLPFRPATTTFQFRLKVGSGEPVSVSSFEMSSTAKIAGPFSVNMTNCTNADDRVDSGNTWKTAFSSTSTQNKITVTFKNGNSSVNPTVSSDYLDFTVFALPVDLTQVTLTLNFVDGGSKRLELKRGTTWDTFDACKKYRITNDKVPGGVQYDYFIEEIPDVVRYGHNAITATDVFTYDVKSYKVVRGTTSPKYPVAWHLEYSADSTSWSTTLPSTGFSALTTTTGVGYDGTTSYPIESGNSTLPNASTGSTTGGAGDATRAVLASATPRGTATAPFDLSTHKVYGTGSTYEAKQADITNTTVARETANCYVISAPGVYMFPLVYGNAIKANGDNKIAYDPANCGDTNIEALYAATNRQTLPTFRNAKNEGISGPGIVGDLTASSLSAVVVWQDAQNLILNPTVITVPGESYPFIQFEVDANYIAQGNAIVALKGSATGLSNEILWSWHIWVTEKDLTPVQINHAVSTHSMMMKYNLGWTDKTTASSTKYPDRKIYVRAVQNEKPASASTYESELFIFWQKGDATRTDDNIGSNPFYQWGRKDPMVGAASDNHYKTVYYGTGYSLPTTDYNGQTVVTPSTPSSATNGQFADAIKNPHKQYFNSGNWGWIGGPIYLNDAANHHNTSIPSNLWNSGVNHQASGEAHHKTVYDPCPPGFCVPNSYAFMGMAGYTGAASSDWNYDVTAHSSSASDGRTFSVGSSMYFPFTGARGAVHGEIYAVKATAYYWMGSITSNSYDQGYGNTQDRYGYHNSKMMYFDSERIWPFHNLYRAACYSIRPVVE